MASPLILMPPPAPPVAGGPAVAGAATFSGHWAAAQSGAGVGATPATGAIFRLLMAESTDAAPPMCGAPQDACERQEFDESFGDGASSRIEPLTLMSAVAPTDRAAQAAEGAPPLAAASKATAAAEPPPVIGVEEPTLAAPQTAPIADASPLSARASLPRADLQPAPPDDAAPASRRNERAETPALDELQMQAPVRRSALIIREAPEARTSPTAPAPGPTAALEPATPGPTRAGQKPSDTAPPGATQRFLGIAQAGIGAVRATHITQHTDGRLELRLDPPHLGTVIVDLVSAADGAVMAVVTAESAEGVQFMRLAADSLLRDAASGGPAMTFEFREGRADAQGGRRENAPGAPLQEWELTTLPPDAEGALTASKGLDLRV